MLLKDLEDKKIIIWGMGTEGKAIKTFLEERRLPKQIFEYNDSDGEEKLLELVEKADVIFRSPGVSIYKPEFLKAKASEIKITSSTNLFMAEMRANHPKTKIIGVTGSKGKSTSVSMLYHMMKALGLKVALGGNIGKALIELLDDDYDYVICELSSYQISDLETFPQVAVFTNLFSVHTDWHGGHEGYCRDKVRLGQGADVAIVNVNNPELMKYTADLTNKIFYGQKEGFHAVDKELFYKDEALINIDSLKISGNHNMENLAGIVTAMDYLGLDWREGLKSLPSFEPLPHRLQKVGTIGKILYINDSISTAPEAAIGAMKSFAQNMVLISGGINNKQDYTDYAKCVEKSPHVKAVVTLFQCGPQIAESIKQYVKRADCKLIETSELYDAVVAATEALPANEEGIVIFTPTAPSFDRYKNFMERGEDFINCVKKLANSKKV